MTDDPYQFLLEAANNGLTAAFVPCHHHGEPALGRSAIHIIDPQLHTWVMSSEWLRGVLALEACRSAHIAARSCGAVSTVR